MAKIQVMSEALASQVAAGEVVERPASVLKELIENSLDAGARTISVEMRRGGVHFLKVVDDGCGMSQEDALLSLRRHATSKIYALEDLMSIRQLGFRGEALPSIASVSHFTLSSRESGALEGVELMVKGGQLDSIKSSGSPEGTSIEIKELFYNIPARRKFLKSEETEAAQCEHQVRLHALAFSQVRFLLRKEGRLVFDLAPSQDVRVRIAQLYGQDWGQKLMLIPKTLGQGLEVWGFMLPVSEARRHRKQQFVFLNGRPVEDPWIGRAIKEGFLGFPSGLHPALFLYLEIEPSLVDVNVHPAKREVRFKRGQEVMSTLVRAFTEAQKKSLEILAGETSFFTEKVSERERAQKQETGKEREEQREEQQAKTPLLVRPQPLARPLWQEKKEEKSLLFPSEKSLENPASPESSLDRQEKSEKRKEKPKIQAKAGVVQESFSECAPSLETGEKQALEEVASRQFSLKAGKEKAREFRFIGRLAQNYFVWENKEGLVLMSGTAARERILFEQLMRAQEGAPLPTQGLLFPLVLEVDVRDYEAFLSQRHFFEKAGFSLSPFGRNTLELSSLPSFIPPSQAKVFLLDLLDSLSGFSSSKQGKYTPYEFFALQLAQKLARQEVIKEEDGLFLLEELLSCKVPYCTPQNKPTLIPYALSDIERKFR